MRSAASTLRCPSNSKGRVTETAVKWPVSLKDFTSDSSCKQEEESSSLLEVSQWSHTEEGQCLINQSGLQKHAATVCKRDVA